MRIVDLFSGCGGMSKGFEKAGFDLRLAVELWKPARDVYAQNFDHPVRCLDLSRVKTAAKLVRSEKPDLIMGGPPCQEFSAAGSRVEGPKAELTVDFAEIVRSVEPKWFILENVPGIQKSMAWEIGREVLKGVGYGITELIVNAAYYGVPQNRKRFFAVGCMGEDDDFLRDQMEAGQCEIPLTIRDFVGDEFGIDYYYRHPRNWGRRGVFSIDEPSPTVRSTNRHVPPGYTAHPEDAGPHNLARPLSARERARVQTFDKKFKLEGYTTDQDIMIANAVPVKLAEHVAAAIRRYEEEGQMLSDPEFRNWLRTAQDYTPRTISNVISRIKRASKILHSRRLSSDAAAVIHSLEGSIEFMTLTPSVRSQIRKAVRLRAEYHAGKQ